MEDSMYKGVLRREYC